MSSLKIFLASVIGYVWIFSPVALVAQPSFTDVTSPVGVEFTYTPEPGTPIGAGVAWEDFDNDGDYDLYAVQGVGCNHLFLNTGGSTFVDELNAAGAGDCDGAGHGVSSADYDNDGDADIYLTNAGQNRLLRNMLVENGSLSFVDETVAAGMDNDGGGNSSSSTWSDYDNDGDADLFVVQHVLSMPPVVCWPDLVYRNEGDGTFTEVGAALGVDMSGDLDVAGCGLGVTTSDYDQDGDQDLMIINDFGFEVAPNRLFRNDGPGINPGDWVFTDVSVSSGFNYQMYGMGIAIGDYDLDGVWDYYMADIGDNNLGRGNGDGTFTDKTVEAGVEANDFEIYGERGLVSWGPVFADLDHDGWEDLCVANGGAPEAIWPGMFGPNYVDENPIYCYRNLGDGTFNEVHEFLGITHDRYYRNVTFVDFDEDGDLDLYFGNLEGLNSLYSCDLAPGPTNWLQVKARGTIGNADAIGALVKVRDGNGNIMMREVDGGSTFTSMSMRTVHFGLSGLDELAELRVQFQSGIVWKDRRIAANQVLEVIEPVYTIQSAETSIEPVAGEVYSIDYTITNHTAASATFDYWVDYRVSNGNSGQVQAPAPITLDGGESQVLTINIDVPAGAPSGSGGDLILKVGSGPEDVIHKDYIDVTIQ